jgi:hypothetical protein
MSPARAVAFRAFADARTRTISFALLFLFASAAAVVGYRSAYPTRADRLEFARSFGDTKAVRLLYGVPHDLLTVGGYAGWRLVGSLSIFAGLWGVLAAVRALRAEEEAGRQELVLAGAVGRRAAFLAALAAIAAGAFLLWLALLVGVLTAWPGLGGSAYLALAIVSPLPVFVVSARSRARWLPPAVAPSRSGRASSAPPSSSAWSPTRSRRSGGSAGRRRSAGPRSCGRSATRSLLSCSCRRRPHCSC